MARTTGRSGFKMKSSPAKNLGNFFSSIFSSGAVKGRQDAQRESNTGEYKGMTDFEKRRAEKKSRKAGESKFQADVRRKRENKKAKSKKADKYVTKTVEQEFKIDPKSEIKLDPKYSTEGNYKYKMTPKTKKSKTGEIPWDKAPKVGTQARTDWYKKFNLKLDETTPLTKKSPYKKGIGSYAKKAKGSRGYTMKRNK